MSDLFAEEAAKNKVDDLLAPGRSTDRSTIVAALWGIHDTCKSGICMDIRTKRQVKDGELLLIFDLDDANEPLHKAHHKKDPNIRVINPCEWKINEETDKTELDYDETLTTINRVVTRIHQMEKQGEVVIAATVFDGLDKLSETSELTMRNVHNLEIDEGATFAYWRRRNKYFMDILRAVKSLKCPKYFITHVKNHQKKKGDKVVDEWKDGDWLNSVPNELWQIVRCEQEDTEKGRVYSAVIEKFKGRPDLIGTRHTVLTVDKGNVKWKGLPVLRDPEVK